MLLYNVSVLLLMYYSDLYSYIFLFINIILLDASPLVTVLLNFVLTPFLY